MRDRGINEGLFFIEARTSSASIFIDFPPPPTMRKEVFMSLRDLEMGTWLDAMMPDVSEEDLQDRLNLTDYRELKEFIESGGDIDNSFFSLMFSLLQRHLLGRNVTIAITDGELELEPHSGIMFYDPECAMNEYLVAFIMKAIGE